MIFFCFLWNGENNFDIKISSDIFVFLENSWFHSPIEFCWEERKVWILKLYSWFYESYHALNWNWAKAVLDIQNLNYRIFVLILLRDDVVRNDFSDWFMFYHILHSIISCHVFLRYINLYYDMLYCSILRCIMLFYVTLCNMISYCGVL